MNVALVPSLLEYVAAKNSCRAPNLARRTAMQSVSRIRATEDGTWWTASNVKGRDDILDELSEFFSSAEKIPSLVAFGGPRGVGTSALAKKYICQLRAQLGDMDPVVIRVDVSAQNCPGGNPASGVAAALLQHFLPGTSLKGYSRDRIMWWFLRRVMAGGSPVVLWLDQLRPNVRTLEGVVKPLLSPDLLLGDAEVLPKVLLVVSGSSDAELDSRVMRIHVPPLPVGTVRSILEDKARQTSRAFTPGALVKSMNIFATEGNSLSVMDEVLKAAVRSAGCHGIITEEDVVPPDATDRPRANMPTVYLCVLEVLRKAGRGLPMGELVRELSIRLTTEGQHIPSLCSVRRWTARMQSQGLVSRTVTVGGDGGTTSVVSLA